MTYNVPNPAAAAAATGSEVSHCLAAVGAAGNKPACSTNQAPSAADVALAKRELTRELLVESLGFARVYAELAQQFVELGDDQGLLYALRNFRHAAVAACSCGAEIRDFLEAGRPQ